MNGPTFVPTPASPKRNMAPFAVGCTLLFLAVAALVVFGGVRLFRSGQGAVQGAGVVAGNFVDAMQAHRYADARALLAPDAQARTQPADLRDLQELLEKRHGTPGGHGPLSNWNINSYNGVTTVRLVMAQKFARGDVPASLVIQDTRDGWRIQAYNFSP